jgi:integrase
MLKVNGGSFWAMQESMVMTGQGRVYKRCGCVDPVTRRQLGRCPCLAGSRHGSWYVDLGLPAGPDGRRGRIRRGGYRSRAAAIAVLAGLRGPRQGDQGGQVLTVGDWLAHWLASRTSPAASTVRGYTAHARLYLVPYLGRVLLAELPRARRPRAVVWTPSRVEHWQRTGERPAVAVWTAAQTAQFLHSIQGHRMYAAYHLIALRGLRRGEAAGLRWCDVDLDGKAAVISQQLQQYDGHLTVCPPKTPHSVRTIALDHTTVAALRVHRDRQRAEAASFGPGHRASGYVFTGLNAQPMAPDRLSRTFKKLAADAGLPPVRHARSSARRGYAHAGRGRGPAHRSGTALGRPLGGLTMASVRTHTRSTLTPDSGISAGQDGCAARDLNPEPAD